MIRVYLASPYTIGDVAVNVKAQMDMADKLMNMGFAPYVPLLSHFQHISHPRPYQSWLILDLIWIQKCECVLRFGGESKGADEEVEYAREKDIPVFFSLEELIKFYKPK